MISQRIILSLLCLLAICWSVAAEQPDPKAIGTYAVVVSRKTYADKNWRKVVDALGKKHNGIVILYSSDVQETCLELSARMPAYACFVARPTEAGRKFVLAIHRMTRRLDGDPYTDVIWGILTGYNAEDALRIAQQSEPLVVRRMLAGMMTNLESFDSGASFSETQKGVMVIKLPGGKPEKKQVPPDTTKALVDWLNEKKPDCFATSGHATTRDWQIGYSYKNGQFRCKAGQLFGLDTKGKRYDINSPNPKVYLPLWNCLMGRISGRECMALAFMHTGGVRQMAGYTVPTWYAYAGGGIKYLFLDQPGRFTLAESFYFNSQTLIHELATRFPKSLTIDFNRFDIEHNRGLIGDLAIRHCLLNKKRDGLRNRDEMGLLWDRDTFALYGDPAWEARLAPRQLLWSQKLSVKDKVYSLTVQAGSDGTWPRRPLAEMLPHRVKNIRIIEGDDLLPVITDNFILLPLKGKFKTGEKIKVVFKAERIVQPNLKALQELQAVRQVVSLLPEQYRSGAMVALARAGGNRRELMAAIRESKKEYRVALGFLIANMPEVDLKSLKKPFLLGNIRFAYQARRQAPWSGQIPEDIFLNYILPYANLNERRDDWRKDFLNHFGSQAWKCSTSSEAAQLLNREVFKTLNVKYHATKRPKPDQSPYESTKAGFASCTGLSILLVDACRAVGIPARIVGTPLWTDKSGNHNWVEIWDGRWHTIAAAEPGAFDKAWSDKKVRAANPNRWQHCIYAASFRKTGITFPLAWNLAIAWVPATDVTLFYTARQNVRLRELPGDKCDVTVRWNGETVARSSGSGTLTFKLAGGQKYDLDIRTADGKVIHMKLNIPVKRPIPPKPTTRKQPAARSRPSGKP